MFVYRSGPWRGSSTIVAVSPGMVSQVEQHAGWVFKQFYNGPEKGHRTLAIDNPMIIGQSQVH